MRIGLLKYREFHDPIVRPLYERLRGAHRCLLTGNEAELVAFRPHVVVLAEAVAARLRGEMPRALFVHCRHGLASKNAAHTLRGATDSDFICVTSPGMRDWYLEHGARPRRDFWVVGYIQMDPLFRDQLPRPPEFPAGCKTILYAPTWNLSLSSAPMLGGRAAELIRGGRRRGDVALVIKPHPLIAQKTPEWMQAWRRMAADEPNVHLVEDTDRDVMPFLRFADVLVTDASSVQLEYAAVDRPMVLISNPARFGSAEYEPSGPEWAWRDIGDEVNDVADLPAAVARALADPAHRREQRARYRDLLFGDLTDGNAVPRAATHIDELRALVPLVTAQWVARWPLERAKGLWRRTQRLWHPDEQVKRHPV